MQSGNTDGKDFYFIVLEDAVRNYGFLGEFNRRVMARSVDGGTAVSIKMA
jgi:hypothetical protein